MKNIHYFLFSFIVLCGCTNTHKNTDNSVKTVVITPDKSITADINDLYYNCTFVQLETTPVSIIGALSSLAVYKDRFYTYDSHGGGAVHCFDKHGKFLFKIAKHGNGPGETMRITDFCIDERNNILWIADNYQKIQKYDMDGHLINEYRTDFALKNIVCVPESNDLLALRFGYYKDKKSGRNLLLKK